MLTPAARRKSLVRRALVNSYEEALANTRRTKPYDIILETLSNLESKGYQITKIPKKNSN
jgi:predicted transcriptional regulator